MHLTLLEWVLPPAWFLVSLQIVTGVVLSDSFSDTITEDTQVYYQKLPFIPSKVVSIKYSISYQNGTFCSHAQIPPVYDCRVVFYLYSVYSEKDKPSLGNCSVIHYEPFRKALVQNLPSYLHLNEKRSRCKERTMMGNSRVNCAGETQIQHYKPCGLAAVFMFKCKGLLDKNNINLNGLQYNVTIQHQSNTSRCERIPSRVGIIECRDFYGYTSLQTFFGPVTFDKVAQTLQKIHFSNIFFKAMEDESEISSVCHQHMKEIMCYVSLPKCEPETMEVTNLCKEMCLDWMKACIKNVVALKKTIQIQLKTHFYDNIHTIEDIIWVCEHFPSKHNDEKCFYKPVECPHPPVVPNAKMSIFPSNQSDINSGGTEIYYHNSQFSYQCTDESHYIEEENTTTCLFTGQWSKPPSCKLYPQSPLPVVMIILLFPTVIFSTILCIWKCMQSPIPSRNKVFDAFVCYHFDTSHNYVTDTLKPELEEQFKLLDSNEFTPGKMIAENIENAIKNNNCAIVLLSQGFVDSTWCRDEFEHCCIENQDDPAFQILVILMQPLESLENLQDNKAVRIRNFIRNRTCLDKDEKKLWIKIKSHLTFVKSKKERKHCCLTQENEDLNPEQIEMLPV